MFRVHDIKQTKRALIIDNLLSELQSNQAYIDKTELKFKREFEYVNKLLLDSLTIQDVKKYPKNFSPLIAGVSSWIALT